jgi:hypothetical protein
MIEMMSISLSLLRSKKLGAALALVACLIGVGPAHSQAIGERPCDIYAAGDTPCVAAHSTVRSLYAKFTGVLYLYQVKRASDNTSQDIGLLPDG